MHRLEKVLDSVPSVQQEALSALEKVDAHRIALRALQPTWDAHERISQKIPALRIEKDKLDRERRTIAAQCDDHASEIAILELELNALSGVVVQAEECARAATELVILEKDLQSLRGEVGTDDPNLDGVHEEAITVQQRW